MGYIYESKVISKPGQEDGRPDWQAESYTPSTYPGIRPPSVLLSDGSALFDHFGKDWSLVTFDQAQSKIQPLLDAAELMSMPLKHVHLEGEHHAHTLWERNIVLVRPDEHVAWRGNSENLAIAKNILHLVAGFESNSHETNSLESASMKVPRKSFTLTVEMKSQVKEYTMEHMSEFQK